MSNDKVAATFHPLERPWRVRYYYGRTVHVTHTMPRLSAIWLAETFRHLGTPAVALPVPLGHRNVKTLSPL
jgi:hypothetical protein